MARGRWLRAPGFTAVATLTLALGIGANTAIFSVVNTVLLKPLSYREPDRLVFVWERNTAIGKDRDLVAPPNYLDWKAQNAVFDALGAYRFNGFALTGAGEPESVTAITLSSSLFRVLGVDAARRPHLHRGGRDAQRSRRRAASRILAAPLRRRSQPRRQVDHPDRRPIHGDRRDAAELPVSRTATPATCTRR